MVLSNIKEIHKNRGTIYMFLYNMYIKQPDKEYYNMICDILPLLQDLSSSSISNNFTKGVEGITLFCNHFSSVSENEKKDLQLKLQQEYTYIMCIPGTLHLEESFYTSQDRLLMQKSYDEVEEILKKYHLKLPNTINEYLDHLSIEMALMGKLSFMNAESYNDYSLLQEQYNFHINHFDKWVYNALDISKNNVVQNSLFYKYLFLFTQGFLAADKEILNDLLEFEYDNSKELCL